MLRPQRDADNSAGAKQRRFGGNLFFRLSQRGGSGSTPENLLSISMTSASRGISLMTFINSSGYQWGNVIGDELLKFRAELRVVKCLAHRFLQDLNRSLGVPGGKTKGETAVLKPRHIAKSFFSFSVLIKLSISGSWGEAWVWMLIALRHFQDPREIQFPFPPIPDCALKLRLRI
jgi:hypothetical protein